MGVERLTVDYFTSKQKCSETVFFRNVFSNSIHTKKGIYWHRKAKCFPKKLKFRKLFSLITNPLLFNGWMGTQQPSHICVFLTLPRTLGKGPLWFSVTVMGGANRDLLDLYGSLCSRRMISCDKTWRSINFLIVTTVLASSCEYICVNKITQSIRTHPLFTH